MKYIMATQNPKKLKEIRRILEPLGISVLSEAESGFDFPEVEENADTFSGNALLKAESVCKISGLPAIADDSGLCVDALNGAPGVYSARYAGNHGDDVANNALLLKNLENISNEKRTAYFMSSVAVVYPDGSEFTVDGKCCGKIGYEAKGSNGFGYDPLFYVGDKSFAELSAEEKDKISHRGRALAALAEKLTNMQ